ncbi:hypothetical protein [Streptomyces sp. NPDC058145]|uniref:hypothetical protein n=1 Tax=Streptomyces sp. NPDC058145 TaxID=3346356 RepID=UPI0036E32B6E
MARRALRAGGCRAVQALVPAPRLADGGRSHHCGVKYPGQGGLVIESAHVHGSAGG